MKTEFLVHFPLEVPQGSHGALNQMETTSGHVHPLEMYQQYRLQSAQSVKTAVSKECGHCSRKWMVL